jgi:hypothetical protein
MAPIATATPAATRPLALARRALGWLLIAVGTSAYCYGALLRPWCARWGATDAELQAALPGDELVAAPQAVTTRAITVNAPAEAIWPWLAQLGQGRGGFYSYEWLENTLLGCDIHNADTINPAWQNVAPGDLVKMRPDPAMPPAYLVAQVLPGRALVLGHHVGLSVDPAAPWAETWQFVIVPVDATTSRLIVRSRSFEAPWINRLLEPGIFLMEERMLRGIRERAERYAGASA